LPIVKKKKSSCFASLNPTSQKCPPNHLETFGLFLFRHLRQIHTHTHAFLCMLLCFYLNIYLCVCLFLSRLHTQHGAQHGAWTHDPEIKTWAEIKSLMLNWLRNPGTPTYVYFKVILHIVEFFSQRPISVYTVTNSEGEFTCLKTTSSLFSTTAHFVLHILLNLGPGFGKSIGWERTGHWNITNYLGYVTLVTLEGSKRRSLL